MLLSFVAIIHLLPMVGALGAARLHRLYGLSPGDPGLVLLLRHRAVLFGLLGAFLLLAAFRPALTTLGLVAGSVSVVSFLALALDTTGPLHASLRRVVAADVVALVCLVVAAALHAAR
ncbi:MAG: phosphopantetheine adenylyltransferase [Myxococcales bacterium]|nr:MAG: phosphopantetheine adenylyltransferase [Myxococcales bacterium]